MKSFSYFLKLGKCEFKQSSVEFLECLVTQKGVAVNPIKATGLAN